MNFDDMLKAVNDANKTKRLFDGRCEDLARLLSGNLRNVSRNNSYSQHNLLCALKAELSQYNAKTRQWKN